MFTNGHIHVNILYYNHSQEDSESRRSKRKPKQEGSVRPGTDTEKRKYLQSPPALSSAKEENAMSINEIDSRVKELRELRRMADELAAEIESIQDSLKEQMQARGLDTLSGSDWKITWKPVTSSRMDTAALKKALPEIAERFMKSTTNRRFVLA